MIGNIGVLHVCPESDSRGELLPHALVFPYAFLTFLNKRLKTVLLDLFFSVKTELLFNLKLNGKSVSIPACFTQNVIALHRAVTGDHILDNTCKHVTYMRLAVCGGGAVIESIGLAALAALYTFLKNFVLFPELNGLFFSFHKVQVIRDLLVHFIILLRILYIFYNQNKKACPPNRDKAKNFATIQHTTICLPMTVEIRRKIIGKSLSSPQLGSDVRKILLSIGSHRTRLARLFKNPYCLRHSL